MTIIDGLIFIFLFTMPIYCYLTYQSEIDAIKSGKKSLLVSYWQTFLLLWPPALLALYSDHFVPPIIGQLSATWHWQLLIFTTLLSVLGYGIYQIRTSKQTQELVLTQMKDVAWIMPKTTMQFYSYLFAVCMTAGVAEEIIYRGYLLPLLEQYVGSYLAVAISSVAFGLAHLYQNAIGVIKTAITGLIFCLLVIIFDSLLLAIACHFIIDAYSGYLYFLALNSKKSA